MSERVIPVKSISKCPLCINSISPENNNCLYSCKLKDSSEWFDCITNKKDYFIKKEEIENGRYFK